MTAERAALGPPFVRAGEIVRGDVVDLGGIPHLIVDVLEGPRAEPTDPRTVWLVLEGPAPARPFLDDDPIRILSDPDGRALWSTERRERHRAEQVETLADVQRQIGEALLDCWPAVRALHAAPARVYLATVIGAATAGRPIPLARIGDLAGTDGAAVRRYVKALVDDGRLERHVDGKRYTYSPSPVDVPGLGRVVSDVSATTEESTP